MVRRFSAALAAALLPVVGQATMPAAAPGTSCANLAALTIPNITIKSSNAIPAGPFAPSSAATPMTLPAFCRVGRRRARPATPISSSKSGFHRPRPGTASSGRRQRRLLRRDRLCGDGHGAAARLCRREHRHRTRRRRREVRPGAPEKVIDWAYRPARDDGSVEAHRPRRAGPFRGRPTSSAAPPQPQALTEAQRYPRTTTASSPATRRTTGSARRSRSCIRGSRRTTRTARRSSRRASCRS